MNRVLMAAGLVDRLQVIVFPVITGENGSAPIFAGAGAADFDLELIESRALDADGRCGSRVRPGRGSRLPS